MKIICPEKTYEQALIECGMETLENRREKMCIKLINDMKDLIRKLNELLLPTVGHVRERDTRLNRNKLYNFKCRTERFSNSSLVHAFANIILQGPCKRGLRCKQTKLTSICNAHCSCYK